MSYNTATARGIIFIDESKEKIISIKRTKYKDGKISNIYYTFPGGHIENNETFEETLIREIKEEICIEINIDELLCKINNKNLKRNEAFYICTYKSGKIKPGNGPEWTNPNIEKYGEYEICIINIDDIKDYNFLPIDIKNIVMKKYSKKQ